MDPVEIDDDVVMKDSSPPSFNTASSPIEPFTKLHDYETCDDTEKNAADKTSEGNVTLLDELPSSSSGSSACQSTSNDIENDSESDNDNFRCATSATTTRQIIDVSKLLDLLSESERASNLIEKKDVMLLVGLTGAGKCCNSHVATSGLLIRS